MLVSTLCTDKKYLEDWTYPGKNINWVLPDNLDEKFELHCLLENQPKNHGYYRVRRNGKEYALTADQSGIYELIPPDGRDNTWKINKRSEIGASDIAACDIDGDGELEYFVIEPFHGDCFRIYKDINGKFTPIWKYQDEVEFGHVAWGGEILKRSAFIGGYREKSAKLFCVFYNPGIEGLFEIKEIDKGQGPANIHVIHAGNVEKIIAANHKAGELVLYELSEEGK